MSWTEFKAHRPTGLWLQQDIKSQEYYSTRVQTYKWYWKLHSSFPVHFDRFLSFEKKKQCQRTKKAPPLPPPPRSQLIFSLRLNLSIQGVFSWSIFMWLMEGSNESQVQLMCPWLRTPVQSHNPTRPCNCQRKEKQVWKKNLVSCDGRDE